MSDDSLTTIVDGVKASRVSDVNCITWNGTSTPLTASATYTGASRDGGATDGGVSSFCYFNGAFFADQAGTASIEASWDGTTWRTVASAAIVANTFLNLRTPVTFRFYRTKVVNGATIQTVFQANSSYTVA
jgi:hypothetical protein